MGIIVHPWERSRPDRIDAALPRLTGAGNDLDTPTAADQDTRIPRSR